MNIIQIIKDCISPKKCYSCHSEWHFLCKSCYKKIQQYNSICHVCKQWSEHYIIHKKCKKWLYYDKLIIWVHYKNYIIKKLIHDGKFYGRKDIFVDFSLLLLEKIKENIHNDNLIICSVPLHYIKKIKRWYNQSEILSKAISKNLSIPYIKDLIQKKRYTWQQSHLSRQQRLKNLKDSFKINKKIDDKIDKKTIILIDDVVSTWSTINEISKVLKQGWAREVIACVIASD